MKHRFVASGVLTRASQLRGDAGPVLQSPESAGPSGFCVCGLRAAEFWLLKRAGALLYDEDAGDLLLRTSRPCAGRLEAI